MADTSDTLRLESEHRVRVREAFERDRFPGRPRILFVGLAESTHTQSWIDLLEKAEVNVRLFAMPTGGVGPEDWWVPTYYSAAFYPPEVMARTLRARYFAQTQPIYAMVSRYGNSTLGRYCCVALRRAHRGMRGVGILPRPPSDASEWLARIIRAWRPHITHTLGLFDRQGGEFYDEACRRFNLQGIGRWVLQLRGGSDLTLRRLDPCQVPRIRELLLSADEIISDNLVNMDYAADLGVPREKFAEITPIPGTGGVDVEALRALWTLPPSRRERLILWPKAYECSWSKALPVFEALQLAWPRIRPCSIHMLAANDEARQWFRALPEDIRRDCRLLERLPRQEVFDLMARARVMLAPSLVDGVPNSLYEAMACGTAQIVSPIPTIARAVPEEGHVFWARNLYPEEIADALVRAMSDDAQVDAMSAANLDFVRERADRARLRGRVIRFYERLAESAPPKEGRLAP